MTTEIREYAAAVTLTLDQMNANIETLENQVLVAPSGPWKALEERDDYTASCLRELLAMIAATAVEVEGHHDYGVLRGHGYVTAIEGSREGSDGDPYTPAAVHVSAGDGGAQVMMGRSPVDGKMVIHIDGTVDTAGGEGIARIYLNDGLIAGREK